MTRFSVKLLVSVLAFGLGLLAHTARTLFSAMVFLQPRNRAGNVTF
jgi:hypothetical protein